MRLKWSDKDYEILKKLREEGVSCRSIAENFGVNHSTISRKLCDLENGIIPRKQPWSRLEIDRLKEMMRDGLTIKEMSAQLKRSFESVKSMKVRIEKEQEPSRTPWSKWSTEEKNQVIELFNKGFSDEKIAEKIGRPWQSVKSFRSRVSGKKRMELMELANYLTLKDRIEGIEMQLEIIIEEIRKIHETKN